MENDPRGILTTPKTTTPFECRATMSTDQPYSTAILPKQGESDRHSSTRYSINDIQTYGARAMKSHGAMADAQRPPRDGLSAKRRRRTTRVGPTRLGSRNPHTEHLQVQYASWRPYSTTFEMLVLPTYRVLERKAIVAAKPTRSVPTRGFPNR